MDGVVLVSVATQFVSVNMTGLAGEVTYCTVVGFHQYNVVVGENTLAIDPTPVTGKVIICSPGEMLFVPTVKEIVCESLPPETGSVPDTVSV